MNGILFIIAIYLALLAVYVWRKPIGEVLKKITTPLSCWSGYWLNPASACTVILAGFVLLLWVLGGVGYYRSVEESFQNAILKGIAVVFEAMEGNRDILCGYYPNHADLMFLICTAVPCLMVSTVILFLIDFFPKPLPPAEEYYIFSQADDRSLLFAEDIARRHSRKEACLIFLRVNQDTISRSFDSRLQKIHARVFPYTEAELLEIHFRLKEKKLRFYFISSDTDRNFDQMKDLVEAAEQENLFRYPEKISEQQYRHQEERSCYWQELYLLSETGSAPMLIDHLRQKLVNPETRNRKPVFTHTDLRLLDRYRMVAYQLLLDKPLHETAKNHSIRVLVLGFGKVGQAFFRAAASFCAMDGYQCSFHLCDHEIEHHWEAMCLEYPECDADLQVTRQTLEAESSQLFQMIEENKTNGTPFTYIMLSLGDDERNIRIACELNRYYRKCYWTDPAAPLPVICVNVENSIKSEYVPNFFQNILVNSGNNSQVTFSPLHVFGDDENTFSEKMLMQRGLWTAARQLHIQLKSYNFTYWPEYERRSSIASAAHACYHIASLPSCDSYEKAYARLSEERQWDMVEAEHKRWMQYVRCEGMRSIPLETAEAYFPAVGYHVDPIGKLTPCLVPAKELKKVYTTLYPEDPQLNNFFSKHDAFVVRNAQRLDQIISDPDANVELEKQEQLSPAPIS